MTDIHIVESIADIEKDKDIIIYGAAETGQVIYEILNKNHYQVKYFMDDNLSKIGGRYKGVEILSSEIFVPLYENKVCILILGSIYIQTMIKNLEKLQLSKYCKVYDMRKLYANEKGKAAAKFIKIHDTDYVNGNIDRLYDICQDNESHKIIDTMNKVYREQYLGVDVYDDICSTQEQYFTDEVLAHISGRKINIIDGGAYQGEILSDLVAHQLEVNKILMFEADKTNYEMMLKNIEHSAIKESCVPINKGLWNEETKLYIEVAGDQSRIVSHITEQSVDVTTIDKCTAWGGLTLLRWTSRVLN